MQPFMMHNLHVFSTHQNCCYLCKIWTNFQHINHNSVIRSYVWLPSMLQAVSKIWAILDPHFPDKRDSSVHIFGLVICSSLWSWYSLVIHSKDNFIFKCLPLYSFQCWYIHMYLYILFSILICSRKFEAASKFSQNTDKGLKPGLKAHICY